MAGMRTVTVACDERGNIDVEDLKAKAEANASELACIMVTYPSTHGVFESRIREIVEIVHDNGGQVYMDGANMNAQVGLTNPGYIGADVCHLNLHKTLCDSPRWRRSGRWPDLRSRTLGGVPAGPRDRENRRRQWDHVGGGSPVRQRASILPITYGYIKMLGANGLRRVTEMAIVNANYMASALKGEYDVVYTGETGRVGHEMILDLRHFRKEYAGVECADIARRLMDYGFHAPTLSFPVHETLMVEPTESEPKAELDRFMEALVQIKRECEEIRDGKADAEDNVVKMAPHTAAEAAADVWLHGYGREKGGLSAEMDPRKQVFPLCVEDRRRVWRPQPAMHLRCIV